MGELPAFTEDGVLPPGDWDLSFGDLRASYLVKGPGEDCPNWDAGWRAVLVDNLETLVRELWEAGIDEVFVDGSFVEDKEHPNDIDGYFECDWQRLVSGELQDALNQQDPHRIWSWDPAERRPYRGYPKMQLPMWHQYRVELYPHTPGLIAGVDHRGHALEFPSWFRLSRRPLPSGEEEKGIVKIRRPS